MWNSDSFDLDAYLTKISYEGDRAPTLETLRALHRGHVLHLRWSTVDAMLHHDVPLDLETLGAKLVTGGRAGYCFEHATLFAAALEALGYDFFAVQGRVVMGETDRILPTSHAMLVVELDGRRQLCDVGFGASQLEPIEMIRGEAGNEVRQDSWRYWLREGEVSPGAHGWALHQPAAGTGTATARTATGTGTGTAADGSGWMVRHTFTETPQYPIDFRVSNYFVASNPHSPFSRRLYVQRVLPDRLHVLDELTLTTSSPDPDVPTGTRVLEPAEVPRVLAELFDIRQSAEEATLLTQTLAAR
ncbi:arylamine N-acetyltransferase [Streptomyces sp. NPDC091272]|uniref:arylamine N-acetyltransferase family protein n=1 Tax=Streptomyces sp. NPDC091272 TaxID=3365981 RepID=UPI0037F92A2C